MAHPAAAIMDIAMLNRLGVPIAGEATADGALPSVADPLAELGNRLLIKYVRDDKMQFYSDISGVTEFPGPHYLTPTPFGRSEVEAGLNLPPLDCPAGALLLLPEQLPGLRGPRRIAGGQTVEYLCDSFKIDALVAPRWAVRI